MPKPFANAQPINPALMDGDWLLGIQTGNNTGDSGLPQMKYIKLSQLTDWVRTTYGQMWRYRGAFSASLPSAPQTNDYFLATATFTVGADTFTENHLYAYNGSSWDDVSDVLTQYASQSQVTDIDDRLTVVELKVDAMGDGVVYKGEVATYADLLNVSDPQTGWEYYVTADASFYIYNGSSWDQIDNAVVQTITSGDTSHAPSGDAVYREFSNVKNAIAKNTAEIENLKQTSAQTEITVNYPDDGGSYFPNLVPAKAATNAEVVRIVGKSRAMNELAVFDIQTLKGWNPNGTWVDNVCTLNGITFTVDTTNKKINVNGTASALTNFVFCNNSDVVGHKCLVAGCPSGGSSSTYMIVDNYQGTNQYETGSGLVYSITGSGASVKIRISSGVTVNNLVFSPIVKDATLILNDWNTSDITTANIPLMVQQIPDLLKYDAYGYSMVDTVVEGVRSVGVNIWDEEWLNGEYNGSGVYVPSSAYLCSKNPIPVTPLKSYYFIMYKAIDVRLYDADMNYLRMKQPSGSVITMDADTHFIHFSSRIGNQWTTYDSSTASQICSNDLDSATKTTYHPHVSDTLSLPLPVTLRSAGSVAEEFDLESGEKTNTIGSVDLGTPDWTYGGTVSGSTNGYMMRTVDPLPNVKMPSGTNIKAELVCARYMADTADNVYLCKIACAISVDGRVNIFDPNYNQTTSPPLFKTEMTGVMLYYELATPDDPTQLTPVINNFIEVEGGGTVNTKQTQSPVIDNSMDVNFDLIP